MLERLFESTVSALCYEVSGPRGHPRGHPAGLAAPYNDVVRFAMRQQRNMPRLLGWGVRAATLVFAMTAVGRHGTLFHRLAPARRRAQVDAWTISRLEPCRDLMKFYTSLAIFGVFSRPAAGQDG